MFAKISAAILAILLTITLNAKAGAPDGQSFASCPQGMNCILGGGPDEASSREFGKEWLHLVSPSKEQFRITLDEALKVISKIPVPRSGDGTVFDQALWTLYVKEVFSQLKLTATAENKPIELDDPATRLARLNEEIRADKARLKAREREIKLLRKQLRRGK